MFIIYDNDKIVNTNSRNIIKIIIKITIIM